MTVSTGGIGTARVGIETAIGELLMNGSPIIFYNFSLDKDKFMVNNYIKL